jgi:membrane-associated phospholipid phosphatase
MRPTCCALCVCAIVLLCLTPATAQTDAAGSAEVAPPAAVAVPPPAAPPPPIAAADKPFTRLFPNLLADLRRLPSTSSAVVLGLGGVVSLVARPNDEHLSTHAAAGGTDQIFAVGGTIGTGYVQVGGALATYALGRLTSRPRLAHVGSDLIRAQALTGLLTHSLKVAVRRHRPAGRSGSYSFPSGHASASFASATVLWRHLGWKVGAPATLIAAYASGARMQENQHYLSDIAFGAALGIVGGRTVTMGHGGPKLLLTPAPVPGGGGIFISLIER